VYPVEGGNFSSDMQLDSNTRQLQFCSKQLYYTVCTFSSGNFSAAVGNFTIDVTKFTISVGNFIVVVGNFASGIDNFIASHQR
jgi:predicted membrane protein